MSAPDAVASELARVGYDGLFSAGERSQAPAVLAEHRDALGQIVRSDAYGDLERLLAAEVLYRAGTAPDAGADVLAPIYVRALALTGDGDRPIVLTGNLWGVLWASPGHDGPLGAHLLEQGTAAVPGLVDLLGDAAGIGYEGSREALAGNRHRYRVKDAAAYFLGRITGHEVPFREGHDERDAEIARLEAAIARG